MYTAIDKPIADHREYLPPTHCVKQKLLALLMETRQHFLYQPVKAIKICKVFTVYTAPSSRYTVKTAYKNLGSA